MSNFIRVFSKARKNYPAAPTKYQVVMSAVAVTIFKDEKDGLSWKRGATFNLGDTAEYGSYNLSYTGKITKITPKTVTIVAYPGSKMAQQHRLSLEEFCWRNFDFNAAETAARNAETMMYI